MASLLTPKQRTEDLMLVIWRVEENHWIWDCGMDYGDEWLRIPVDYNAIDLDFVINFPVLEGEKWCAAIGAFGADPIMQNLFVSRLYYSYLSQMSLLVGENQGDCDDLEIPCEKDPNPSPLVVPIHRDEEGNIQMTEGGVVASAPGRVRFDYDNDGIAEPAATVGAQTAAFIGLDLDGDGTIDNGCELFGDQCGQSDGFAALAVYDEHEDGVTDDADPIFQDLVFWWDDNIGGKSQLGETRPVSESGVVAISLSRESMEEVDQHGNVTQWLGFLWKLICLTYTLRLSPYKRWVTSDLHKREDRKRPQKILPQKMKCLILGGFSSPFIRLSQQSGFCIFGKRLANSFWWLMGLR